MSCGRALWEEEVKAGGCIESPVSGSIGSSRVSRPSIVCDMPLPSKSLFAVVLSSATEVAAAVPSVSFFTRLVGSRGLS